MKKNNATIKCLNCGGQHLKFGELPIHNSRPLHFACAKNEDKFFQVIPTFTLQGVLCVDCGFVSLSADPEEIRERLKKS
ncbi:MAG: hypothetical protein A2233_04250 [Candidatus Kerfeldbacteria bacterium RIFOXYA2_FULL_38_24]|uniref:Uncharacterized protein n=1 Tax=Candidatus Kerfeldbacteria bacterium RIFOXYB2_FULL_38_14 TaxID=1798547 RepID=A0A1G2BF83_9BACT|nr:MAG: hypothetical protein A2233_04250 [Candidatus Kerfeldbacteria bacterium RIFOXYA2_FULL_38_24]OGY86930.1 MAG: hypothetical protein A2319_00095 [Candidatus Kerfeldbacteria bacterium RIFOXYB2_FULL_38_14]OGY89935.1 MAG: hypothetical protein A2458_05100 [Candidatus Kerfeldbacteria bacterium RIFOXYC2_FULL_38_9]